MASVTFDGVAPIPAGTNVKLLVDNPDNPTRVMEIMDTDHRITFSFKGAATRAVTMAAPANFVNAVVEAVEISKGQTTLHLAGISPA